MKAIVYGFEVERIHKMLDKSKARVTARGHFIAGIARIAFLSTVDCLEIVNNYGKKRKGFKPVFSESVGQMMDEAAYKWPVDVRDRRAFREDIEHIIYVMVVHRIESGKTAIQLVDVHNDNRFRHVNHRHQIAKKAKRGSRKWTATANEPSCTAS